jgi:sarcosine oxidase
MQGNRQEVIVVGLGAAGGAIAYHLARQGVRVLGLDRFAPPHAQGSSHGHTRVIREAYFEHQSYVPLVQRAYRLWRELEADAGRELLRVTGAVMLGLPESEAVQGSLDSATTYGLPHERLSAREVRERFPVLRPAPEMVGIFEPRAGALAVETCVSAQLEAARAGGAVLRFDEPVIEWSSSGAGVEVVTERGRYGGDCLVLAAGAWMPTLEPWLPLEVQRQVQLWFRPVARASELAADRCPIFLWELAPEQLFYGLPDLGDGVKAARHHGGERTTVTEVRRDVTEADVAEVRRFLARCVPGADGELLASSVCLYTNRSSGRFLIDRHPEHPRTWLVSPCSGHGFKFAPVIGERVAAWIVSGEPHPDLALFRL